MNCNLEDKNYSYQKAECQISSYQKYFFILFMFSIKATKFENYVFDISSSGENFLWDLSVRILCYLQKTPTLPSKFETP